MRAMGARRRRKRRKESDLSYKQTKKDQRKGEEVKKVEEEAPNVISALPSIQSTENEQGA